MLPSGNWLAPQIKPPCSDPSSLINSIPAASLRSGRGYSFFRFQAPGKSARLEIVRRTVPSGSTMLILRAVMTQKVWLRTIAAPPRTTAANAMVITPEYTARKRGLERNFILFSFLREAWHWQAPIVLLESTKHKPHQEVAAIQLRP